MKSSVTHLKTVVWFLTLLHSHYPQFISSFAQSPASRVSSVLIRRLGQVDHLLHIDQYSQEGLHCSEVMPPLLTHVRKNLSSLKRCQAFSPTDSILSRNKEVFLPYSLTHLCVNILMPLSPTMNKHRKNKARSGTIFLEHCRSKVATYN